MKASENEIVRFIEPVFYFCLKRVNNRADAEDLASEIMLHVLDGVRKYDIKSLEGWVWRIAHNGMLVFMNHGKTNQMLLLMSLLLISWEIMMS